jgi:23S rRNA (adenine2503-C2)-methyltransferase
MAGRIVGLNIKGLSLKELQEYLRSFQLPSYRAAQIYDWLYQKKVAEWDEMTNLPIALRENLKEKGISLGNLLIAAEERGTDGTVKYLFELSDQRTVESVYLPEPDRKTVCFSTQVGCAMGCVFCATGQCGFIRNLTVAEIVAQPLEASRQNEIRIDNLVAMGQGEPLANYENLIKAIYIFNDPNAFGIGARHITISSCGYLPGIYKLAEEPFQVNLAISLHAATDDLRDSLMPINRKYSLKDLMEACRYYLDKTGRRITFEYTMIDGINDRQIDLEHLIQLISGMLCHVNLIPFNPIPNSHFKRSSAKKVHEFAMALNEEHIEATVRKERGTDLSAACGQLQGKLGKQ